MEVRYHAIAEFLSVIESSTESYGSRTIEVGADGSDAETRRRCIGR